MSCMLGHLDAITPELKGQLRKRGMGAEPVALRPSAVEAATCPGTGG